MIEMDKKYKTRSGLPVRILCNDYKNNVYTVIAAVYDKETGCESTISVTNTGSYIEEEENPLDLIEVTPYDDFKEDDLCVVWKGDNHLKDFRYFSHVENGKATCFTCGYTSYTTKHTAIWPNCRKATEEEIKTKTIKD